MDLLGGLDISTPAAPSGNPTPVAQTPAAVDPFGFDNLGIAPTPAVVSAQPDLPVVLSGDQFNGMTVHAKIFRENGMPIYKIAIVNNSPSPLSGFMLQFNKNSFGLQPADQVHTFLSLHARS